MKEVMKRWVIALCILNAIDGIATISWVKLGLGQEMNPFMDFLIQTHWSAFLGYKLLIVPLFAYLGYQALEKDTIGKWHMDILKGMNALYGSTIVLHIITATFHLCH